MLDELRKRIEKSKLTGKELAALAGVSESLVSNFRRGLDIKVSSVEKIAAALGYALALKRVRAK